MCEQSSFLADTVNIRATLRRIFGPSLRQMNAQDALFRAQPARSGPANPFPGVPIRMLVKVPAHYRLPYTVRTEADRVCARDVRVNHPRVPEFALSPV